MKDFTASIGFIIFVLCMILGVTMVFGEKVANYFLWLILLGMLVVNADKITALINYYSTPGMVSGNTSDIPQRDSIEWKKLDASGGSRT